MEDLFLEYGLTIFECLFGFVLVSIFILFSMQTDVLVDLISQFSGV